MQSIRDINKKYGLKAIREIANSTKKTSSAVENLKKITSNRILFSDSYSGLPSDAAFASQEAEFIKKHPGVSSNVIQKMLLNQSMGYDKYFGLAAHEIPESQGTGHKMNEHAVESDLKTISLNRSLYGDSYAGLPSDAAFASQEAEFKKKHPGVSSNVIQKMLLNLSMGYDKYFGIFKEREIYTDLEPKKTEFVSANKNEDFAIDMMIPKDLQSALSSKYAVVITEYKPPFKIVHVNKAWENLCGFTSAEAIGKTSRELLHGPETFDQDHRLTALTKSVKSTQTFDQMILTNYTKNKVPFENRLTIAPFSIDSVPHLVGVLEPVGRNANLYK